MQQQPEPLQRTYLTAAIYLAGAAAYFLLVEVLGANFLITPLFMGGIMLVASTQRPRLLAPAVLLGCWGLAVLLLNRGVLSGNRTAAVYIAAFGLASLILLLLRRRLSPPIALEGAAVVMIVSGLALYASYDVAAFGRGWLWALVLALNAAGLVLAGHWRHRHAAFAAAG